MKRLEIVLILLTLALGVSFANAQTQQLCYTSNGVNCVQAIATSTTTPINISSATTAQVLALDVNKSIYVTSWDAISSAAGTLQWVYGTGTNCATGQNNLSGAYSFGASTVFSKGNGLGAIFVIPKGNALCVVSTSTINAQGSISSVQF